MEPMLAYNIWLKFPQEIRDKLVPLFGIVKTGRVTVEYRANGAVVTGDGFTPDDIRAISLAKLQTILKTDETDFYGLIEVVVDNIDAIIDGEFEYKPKKVEKEKLDVKVGDRVYIEDAWEDENGQSGPAYARILKIDKKGKLKLEFEDENLREALDASAYRAEDITRIENIVV